MVKVVKKVSRDTMIFSSFLEERSQFVEEVGLRKIETDVTATSNDMRTTLMTLDLEYYNQWKVNVCWISLSKRNTKLSHSKPNQSV